MTTTEATTGLEAFHAFLGKLVQNGCRLSPREAMEIWQSQPADPLEFALTVCAVREAQAELNAGGKLMTAEELEKDLRQRVSSRKQS
jgi:hypothetical protein